MIASSPRIVFCFAGQGYVPLEAARDLYRTCDQYSRAIEEIDHEIDKAARNGQLQQTFIPLRGYFLEDEIRSAYVAPFDCKENSENQEEKTTPPAPLVIFAAQYALAKTIQWLNLEPTDVVGYSLGEHCASAVTGSLPLDAALKLLLRREALFGNRELVQEEGGMLTVQETPDQTTTLLAQEGLCGAADVSGFPHPNSTILSGNASALDEIHGKLSESKVDAQRRAIKYGMHATHVQKVAHELRTNQDIFPEEDSRDAKVVSGVAHWSNVSGARLKEGSPLNANYWATHLTTPIHYKQCIEGIYAANKGAEVIFLDLGMGPRLTRLVQNTLQDTPEWKSGRMRAINCIVSTSMDESEKSERGWAEKALRANLGPLVVA